MSTCSHISSQGEPRPARSTPQGSPQLVKAAGVVRVNNSHTEDASCARAGLWEAVRRFVMQRLGLAKTSKDKQTAGKAATGQGKGESGPAVHV